MRNFATLFLLILVSAGTLYGQKTYEFKNGSWFNGKGFEESTWYVSNGKLTKKAPSKIDSTIDLKGRWVIPPVGDAHCSSVAGNPSASYTLGSYFSEGIFYLNILSNDQESRTNLLGQVNKAKSPDLRFSNGGITCTLGTPFVKYEGPANQMRNPQKIAENYQQLKLNRKMLGDGYWFIDSKEALNQNWKKIVGQKPQSLSIYLLDAKNKGGQEGQGLTPEMAKLIVKKARRAKIPVWAHVETAEDVRLGLKLKVHGFANLPGALGYEPADKAKYELTKSDLSKLAKKNTPIIPLLSQAQSRGAAPELQKHQAELLSRLLSSGVNVVIGSDDPQRTIRSELNYWFQLGGLDNAQVIQILCEHTPQAIFPDRKIGKIAEGYEASFLVLNDNPINNLLKIRVISFMVKNGVVVAAAE